MFPKPTREFRVEVDLVAEMAVLNPFDFFIEPYAENYPFTYTMEEQHELAAVPRGSPPTARSSRDYLATIDRHAAPNHRFPGGAQPAAAAGHPVPDPHGARSADAGRNAGQGLAAPAAIRGWLLVQLLRHLGFAARFVSGYLIQLKADVKSLDGPSGTEQDFTDLHAWCEVYLPGAGWVGLDPDLGSAGG